MTAPSRQQASLSWTRIGELLAGTREVAGLTQEELAHVAGTSAPAITDAEKGRRLVLWEVVDALDVHLRAAGHERGAADLRRARNLLESSDLGEPGSACLCWGSSTTEDWHLVHRQPGQVACDRHGEPLFGHCFMCRASLVGLSAKSQYCPGCTTPLGALAQTFHEANEGAENLQALLEAYRDDFDLNADGTSRRGDGVGCGGRPLRVAQDSPARQAKSGADTTRDQVASHNQHLSITKPADLGGRAKQYYEAAQSLTSTRQTPEFTRADLVAELKGHSRKVGTVLPNVFCLGAKSRRSREPWFLLKLRRGRYAFVGLSGNGEV